MTTVVKPLIIVRTTANFARILQSPVAWREFSVRRLFLIILKYFSAGHPGKHVYVESYDRILQFLISVNRCTVVSSALTYVATLANYRESQGA